MPTRHGMFGGLRPDRDDAARSRSNLEDVEEGGGELQYAPGSHRLPEYLVGGRFEYWDPERDGAEEHRCWAEALPRRVAEAGFQDGAFEDLVTPWAGAFSAGATVIVVQPLPMIGSSSAIPSTAS